MPAPPPRSTADPGIVNSPQGDYALQDFGHGRRLERLGRWLIDRPAPQAEVAPLQRHWQADWVYDGARTGAGAWSAGSRQAKPDSDSGSGAGNDPDEWPLQLAGQTLHCRLAAGGQVGLYPEHLACWRWLTRLLHDAPADTAMLNLFGATGGASLAAARAGARVTHVDAQARALQLARRNLDGCQPGVRVLREDAQQFVARALRRGDHYPLIVLDPPSFGRGPKGQTWSLKRDLPPLLDQLSVLLGPAPVGLWLSTHTPGWDADALRALIIDRLPLASSTAFALGVRSVDGRVLSGGHAVTCQWPPPTR